MSKKKEKKMVLSGLLVVPAGGYRLSHGMILQIPDGRNELRERGVPISCV